MARRTPCRRRRRRRRADDGRSQRHDPRLVIPFDARTAAERIQPYLDRQEANLATEPAGLFKFCWDVARLGYPVFQPIVHCWAEGLEARGIGVPGTVAAIGTAAILLDRAEKTEPLSWSECQRDVLPLLGDPHPMVAAGAGRWLGALCAAGVLGYPDAPDLATLLNRLAERPVNRAAIAGGFVNGFDTSGRGLASLTDDGTVAAAGFDLDDWIVACLAPDDTPPYIPNAQALWFHVHEHYAADPAFVARLIDHGHAWIAMMCATEIDDPVEGMGPVLERLAVDPDPDVAGTARRHLARHY